MGVVGRRSDVLDCLLAAALAAYAAIDIWLRPGTVPGPRAVTVIGLGAVMIPLAFRARRPLLVACLSMGALAAESIAAGQSPEGGVVLVPVLLVLYSVAAHAPLRPALAGAAVTTTAVLVQTARDPNLVTFGDMVVVDGFFLGMLGSAAWLAGRYVRRRRAHAGRLEHRARELERQSEQDREIVAAERSRIARELHDIISHTVSVMGVQAAAAAAVLDTQPERARESLETIETTARDTVLELSRLLAVLRDDGEAVSRAPQPGLASVPDLLKSFNGTGPRIAYTVDGDTSHLPPGLDLAAYRIVQEALTNIRKHATARQAWVEIDASPRAVEIAVMDDGRGTNGDGFGTGRGLVGMRERAALYGGTFQAGPMAEGGFEVRVCLPVPGANA